MSRDALARLFPDGKTVFIPSDGQPMPGYDLARAEIEARGGEIQTASSGGLFGWLFGARGGGEDDAEESGGLQTMAVGRGGRASAPAVQIADAGPEAVARAKRNLPTGPTYASAPSPASPPPVPAPAPAEPAPAPEPAAKPEVVATLEQPSVESDASPAAAVKLHDPIAALYLAPLPPRRPNDLNQQVAGLANIPLPPVRPSDLDAGSRATAATPPVRPADLAAAAPDTTGSTAPSPPARPAKLVFASAEETAGSGVKSFAQSGGADLVADALDGALPKVITQGVALAPTRALALAETSSTPKGDDNSLLSRAAELTAPLPPMPIPNVGAPSHSPIKSVTGLTIEEVKRLFGALPFDAFKSTSDPAPSSSDLRGSQQ